MAIKILNSELNKDYIHQGVHRLVLSFKGISKKNGDIVKVLLRSKMPEILSFVIDGKDCNDIRFDLRFSNEMQEFEKEVTVKQHNSPEQTIYAGFLISGRNTSGDTAADEFVLQCR
jgi:hypothetical protein